jgi:DNA-binding beta-propeller fold protein YncE
LSLVGVGVAQTGRDGPLIPSRSDILIVLSRAENNAVLVDRRTGRTLGKIPTGTHAHEIVLAPDGRYAFTANYRSHDISVLDLRSLTEKKED